MKNGLKMFIAFGIYFDEQIVIFVGVMAFHHFWNMC